MGGTEPANTDQAVQILQAARPQILARWRESVRQQPFHADKTDAEVQDHVPQLLEAIEQFIALRGGDASWPHASAADEVLREPARLHGRQRFEEGLKAEDVAVELRLLRQVIGQILAEALRDKPLEALRALALVVDAVDASARYTYQVIGAHEDERQRLAEQLAQVGRERDRTLQLLNESHDAILTWRMDGRVFSWNKGAERLYGYTSDEAIGRDVHQLLQTADDQLETFLAGLGRDGYWEGDLVHLTKGGESVVVESRQVRIEEGNAGFVLECNRDVTARRQAEEEREWLLAGAVHDLRTPLTVIKATSQMLERHIVKGAATREESIELLADAAARLRK